jgi:hypothetical protein
MVFPPAVDHTSAGKKMKKCEIENGRLSSQLVTIGILWLMLGYRYRLVGSCSWEM